MPFLVFERIGGEDGLGALRATGEHFSLAGHNLLYEAWQNLGRPINQGWHVSADELIQLHSEGRQNYNTRRLVIDYDPRSRERVALIELLDVYAYTWEGTPGKAAWTPLMLRLRDVCEQWYSQKLTSEQKKEVMQGEWPEPEVDSDDFVEFLYLQKSWQWGRVGSTNAAFIHAEARAYFRQFF